MDVFVQVNDVKTTDRAYRRPISLISPLELKVTLTLKFLPENLGGGNIVTFSAFMELLKNFERTQFRCAITHFVPFSLFNFRHALIS